MLDTSRRIFSSYAAQEEEEEKKKKTAQRDTKFN
jgi:hypothetical protein